MRLLLKARSALIVITAVTALLLVRFTIVVVKADTFEIDQEGQVNQVIDGDTFNLKSGDKIRLADIDAPESNDPGYQEAKDYLTDLFNQYGWYVFLDVDDITGADPYGRLVCVAFVNYNGTHYLNVNKAMMETRHAYIDNYANNEFDPYSWQLLVAKSSVVPEFHGLTIIVALVTMTLFTAIARARKTRIRVQGRDKKELTPSRTIFFSFRYTIQGLLLE
jgi:micrococcal nuclease